MVSEWPQFAGAYLSSVMAELQRRRKGISYYGHLELSAGIDRHKLSVEEAVEITFTPQTSNVLRLSVSITICEDGDSRLQIRHTAKKRHNRAALSVRREGSAAPAECVALQIEWILTHLASLSDAFDELDPPPLLEEMKRRWMEPTTE